MPGESGRAARRAQGESGAAVAAEHPELEGRTATFSQNGFYDGLPYVCPEGLNTEFLRGRRMSAPAASRAARPAAAAPIAADGTSNPPPGAADALDTVAAFAAAARRIALYSSAADWAMDDGGGAGMPDALDEPSGSIGIPAAGAAVVAATSRAAIVIRLILLVPIVTP
jgi:hypothetical protein